MRIITEDQYALEQAGVMPHATHTRSTANMSGAALKRAQAQHTKNLEAWQQRVDRARAEYRELIATGELKAPSRLQQLIARANGHPDNPSTQAARRVLDKNKVSWIID